MKSHEQDAYITRDTILKMLSNDEISKASMSETASRLPEGDEYLDLQEIERGVQRADGASTPMGHVLAKNSVHPNTWTRILAELAAPRR